MEDSISRQAAIEAHCELCPDRGSCSDICPDVEVFKLLPSAEPEIIRCKDCGKREICRTSTVWAVAPGDDWFCADAERRTDG